MLAALQSESVNLSAAAPGALRTFFRIVADWQLSAQDTRVLLGNPPESTFYKWKSGQVGQIGRDVIERISYVLGIYKALPRLQDDKESFLAGYTKRRGGLRREPVLKVGDHRGTDSGVGRIESQ